jgi:NodT family efflux transporter outer membrane factor (OMF) lipoprotein
LPKPVIEIITMKILSMSRTCLQLSFALAAIALSGCAAVGPDYTGAPTVAGDAVQAKNFARGTPETGDNQPVAAWWTALGDTQLNALIEQALRNSPDLHAAQARLRQSRTSLKQQQAQRLPTVSATAAAAAIQTAPGTDSSQTARLYVAGFDATWEVDLFGGTRRAIEAASAEAEAVEADLADVQVSLAAEVASEYIELRAQQQRRALAAQIAALDQQTLTLTQQRHERGVASSIEVEQMRAQAENSQAMLNEIDAAIAASLDQLALLTGQSSGALDGVLVAQKPLPEIPTTVAVGDPGAMIQRRPDIRAAERRLASSQAQIGEKVAGYFPKLNFFGDIGFSADSPGHLIRSSSATLIGVPYLTWNFLDFGRTKAAVRGAEAGRDQAIAKYESAVLTALRDANTSLSRYGYQRDSVLKLLTQQSAITHSTALTQQRRNAGAASQLEVLDAERTLCNAQQNSVAGQADLLKDFVSLQKSLGLGWRTAS